MSPGASESKPTPAASGDADREIESIKRRLREALPRLRETYAVEQLYLHGSRLRDEAGPESDLDVLVDFQDSEAGREATLLDFHKLGLKPSSFRRAALAVIFRGARTSTKDELPQRIDERIPTRVAYTLRDQISPGMGDKVPVPRSKGGGCPPNAGTDPSDLPRSRCADRERARRQGSRAHPRVEPSDVESIGSDEEGKRSVVAQIAAGVCSFEEAVLGETLLGQGVFLRDERPSHGRADPGLHRGTRPGASRSGFYGRRLSFSRLPVVTPSTKPLDFQSRVV